MAKGHNSRGFGGWTAWWLNSLRPHVALLGLFLCSACGAGGPGPLDDLGSGSSGTPAELELSEVLSQLQTAAAPDGVDPAIYAELTRELSRVLAEKWGQRLVSGAPQGASNSVSDLTVTDDGAGGQLLEWSYLNTGDYDQNSVVGVTDLTPIGIHFGQDDSDPDWDSFAFVDGDGNGRISVADVTPIGLNYLSKVTHYEIATYDAGSEDYTTIGEALFTSAAGSPKRFSLPLPGAGLDQEIAVRPADGLGDFGPWSSAPPPEPIDALPGPASDAAVLHIPDMGVPTEESSDFFILEDNFALSHTLLLVSLDGSVTVGAVNTALTAAGASIIGADPRGDLLYLRIPASDFSDTAAALESLIDSGAVADAVMEMAGAPDLLPLHCSHSPSLWTFEVPNYSFLPLASANYWIKTVRAPQAWNLDTYIRRNRAANTVEAAVIDGGFDTGHEDLGARIDLGGSANGPATDREHGTFVAGLIAADGGNGLGVAGLYPWGQKIHCRTSKIQIGVDLVPWNQQIHSIIDLLFEHPEVRAVNNSYGHSGFYTPDAPGYQINPQTENFGDRNGDGDANDSGEWPSLDLDRNGSPDTYAQVMSVLGRMYNGAIAAYSAERGNSNFIIAASAGNAGPAYRTQDNSPIANAAVNFGGSFICVEATTDTNALASFSDINGTLSAPGLFVRSCEADNGSNFDAASAALRDDGSSAAGMRYATQSGTSFSAPQACALACLLWKLQPDLTLAQLRTLLSAPAYTVTTGSAPRLDCFAAALGIDQQLGNHDIQRALADIDDGSLDGNLRQDPWNGSGVSTLFTTDQRRGDGSIDMSDFRAFRDAWLLSNSAALSISGAGVNVTVGLDGAPSHFKNDLNFDGAIGLGLPFPPHPVDIGVPSQAGSVPAEDVFPRCDLNGDGRIGSWSAAAPVLIDPDSAFGSTFTFDLEGAAVIRRDLDVLLDPACWSDSAGGYVENAGNIKADEGSTAPNGSWLPRRFILANRDGYITDPAGQLLRNTPDYLHSLDFQLRINWDSLDPAVTGLHIELASDMWPDGSDNNGTGGTDEPFEQSFERYADLPRGSGSQDMVVTIPLWTGTLRLRWEALGAGGDCTQMVSKIYSGLAFGQDLGYTLPGDSGGNSNWELQSLDQAGGAGEHSSIALVAGKPAIAYFGNGKLRYIRASSSDGADWGAPQDVASAAGIGTSINLRVIAGLPGIGYSDSSFDDETLGSINAVCFAHSLSPTGLNWEAPVKSAQITTGIPQMGWHNDLIELGGKPAMCFLGEDYEMVNGTALNFTSASAADGAGWNPSEKVDSAGSPEGLWCSMAVLAGNPAIAYLSSVNNKLCFARASSADGSAWAAPQELDDAGGFDYFNGPYPGRHASLASINGHPAIAYFGGSDLELGSLLKYIQASDSAGSAWNAPLILHSGSPDPGAASGVYCSLASIGGYPAVSFHNMGDGDLLYIEAVDADGLLWFASEEVDCTGDVGRWSSLCELADGRPGISYYDASSQALKFARRVTTP